MMIKSPEILYERERIFNKQDPTAPPRFGVCFSGGGNRSAAFAIGVLHNLHERGLLDKVDVISAVSGGSYALSWFLLQPFYHHTSIEDPKATLSQIQDEMFDLNGSFQRYLVDNAKPLGAFSLINLFLKLAVGLPFDLVLFNILRVFSMSLSPGSKATKIANLLNALSWSRTSYREGIQRTYQIFPDPQKKVPVEKLSLWDIGTKYSQHLNITIDDVPPVTFPALSKFAQRAGLPSFVFNTTVRPPLPRADSQLSQRIFELGPMGLGSNSCGYLTWADTEGLGWEPGTRIDKGWMLQPLRSDKTRNDPSSFASPFATIRNFNVASAISGAALSATNITNKKIRLLLQLLNMGLEYVVPSPADRNRVIRLSDGGHSENLGAFALLRRRCRTILVVDAEHDPSYRFCAYRKLKQAAKQELGIEINIPSLEEILTGKAKFEASIPIQEGMMTIDDQHKGKIYYMKLSKHANLLGDRAEIINSYAKKHLQFPQESTLDQYFQPAQFRAYRALGYVITQTLPPDVSP